MDCYCTNCMERYQLRRDIEKITPMDEQEADAADTIVHGGHMSCPYCHARAETRSEGISRQKLNETHYVVVFLKNGETTVYAAACVISCEYGVGGMDAAKMEEVYYGARIEYHSIIEYKPGQVQQAIDCYRYGEINPYIKIIGVKEPIIYYMGSRKIFTAYNPELLQDTFLKYHMPRVYLTYSQLQNDVCKYRYSGYRPLEFLAMAAKYPAVEFIIKNGGKNIIHEIIDDKKSYKSVIDLSGRSAAEVFRTDANEAAIIRRFMQDGMVTVQILQCWRRLKIWGRHTDRKFKFEDAIYTSRIGPYEQIIKLMKTVDFTPTKLINYIQKIAEKEKNCPNGIVWIYRDYIDECVELGYDVRDLQISKPADLHKAHERTSSALQVVREERARQEQAKLLSEYVENLYSKWCKKYEYSDKKFTVIVPHSAMEIVNEGAALHHCVAGYADRHMHGELTILFMRDVHGPDVPLYTIEMNGDSLRQIHGKYNRTPDKAAWKFVEKWLKIISGRKEKKKECAA